MSEKPLESLADHNERCTRQNEQDERLLEGMKNYRPAAGVLCPECSEELRYSEQPPPMAWYQPPPKDMSVHCIKCGFKGKKLRDTRNRNQSFPL